MKTKVSKILLALLLLLLPAISPTYNVHAKQVCIYVDHSLMDLSLSFLLDSHNFNSPEMKRYLIKCIELSEALSEREIEIIKEKTNHVSFFCLRKRLYDEEGRPILYMWLPGNVLRTDSIGELFYFSMENIQ